MWPKCMFFSDAPSATGDAPAPAGEDAPAVEAAAPSPAPKPSTSARSARMRLLVENIKILLQLFQYIIVSQYRSIINDLL